jgi:hypothetical protein
MSSALLRTCRGTRVETGRVPKGRRCQTPRGAIGAVRAGRLRWRRRVSRLAPMEGTAVDLGTERVAFRATLLAVGRERRPPAAPGRRVTSPCTSPWATPPPGSRPPRGGHPGAGDHAPVDLGPVVTILRRYHRRFLGAHDVGFDAADGGHRSRSAPTTPSLVHWLTGRSPLPVGPSPVPTGPSRRSAPPPSRSERRAHDHRHPPSTTKSVRQISIG